MNELKEKIDDTLKSIADAKRYMLRLGETDKLREALDLGKRWILYIVLLYTVTCSACKMDAALTQASYALGRGWRLPDITTLTGSMTELSKQFLRINRQNPVFC